ncbi:ParA family partition ATPase [Azoarcus sp. DN11]|uniref:ParA family partition ATPase n=1 Tax=Azoarcus sp. DN11 TaxID=356837 RepID=UPI000EB2170D|nr:ParA family partition ATPase [Azoarcus sp. DN11]AYH43374.1 chromosome partitioning protein ParA [Azoarcus sp. DN11]
MNGSKVIALLSQKGGSGKTTVTMQLAAALVLRGYRVAVADLDPQESATRWAESAPADAPFPARMLRPLGDTEEIRQTLWPATREVDFILFDCPPSIEHPHTVSALELCDFAIVPVVPSPTDLWSTRAIEKVILNRIGSGQLQRAALLPNRVMRTALAADVLEVMRDFSLPVLDAALSQRSAYAQSAVMGASVYELGRAAAPAQEEVDRLVSVVLEQLGE